MDWNDYFYYDEASPSCLRWKVAVASGRNYSTYKILPGDKAGTLDTNQHWQIKWNKKLYQAHAIIWAMFHGKLKEGLVIDHEDRDSTNNKVSNLRDVAQSVNCRNRNTNKNNTSGTHGVNLTNVKGNKYWMAQWRSLDGKNKIKSFSVKKYGNEVAFKMACEYRSKVIAELNEQGAGYTERHGT